MIAPLQAAIFDRLNNYAPLTALLATHGGFPAIFDEVPQGLKLSESASFPYVVMHDFQYDENDTDLDTGFSGVIVLHTWSNVLGFKEVYAVMAEVYNALHRYDLTVSGYGLSSIHQEFADTAREPDGVLRQGVQRFRVYLEPIS